MGLDKYELVSSKNLTIFEFVSFGAKGEIHKIIQYSHTGYHNLYNLGFGDKNIETGDVNDEIVSNNGDSEKVLRTVIESLHIFTENNPDAMVYAKGSSESRTRLYQMGISKYLEIAKKDFLIFGMIGTEWHVFQKQINYEAFLVKKINR